MRLTRKPPDALSALFTLLPPPGPAAIAVTGLPREPLPVATGRAALELALVALGMTPGHTVLLPEFICDVVLLPLANLGLHHQYYPLTDDLAPDWTALEQAATQLNSGAVLLLHPFGQPQDAVRCVALCARHNLVCIEDNAHGWGAHLHDLPLGTYGAAGIASPWKQYPVPHGGLLMLNDPAARVRAAKVLASCATASVSLFKPAARRAVRQCLELFPPLRRCLPAPHSLPEPPAVPEQPAAMDLRVHRVLHAQSCRDDASTRRAIYAVWESWACSCGLVPVFAAAHPESAPLCFAAYAHDATTQADWLNWGWQHDIAVHTWPTLPRDASPVAHARKQRLLCFPIHHRMQADAVRAVLDALPLP